MPNSHDFERLALLVSDTERAQAAADDVASALDFVSLEEADAAIVLGGDGFMLQTLHAMLDAGNVKPVYGMNLGTVGFLMNRYDKRANIAKRTPKGSLQGG